MAPPTAGDPVTAMLNFLKTAVTKGVGRFVLHSSSPDIAGGHPWLNEVHHWLKENTPDWAVLRPTWFMQNFSEGQRVATIRADDAIYSATDSGRVPFISVDDIASVACAALTAPKALNSDFILTGNVPISYDRVAELISAACGRWITHRHISAEALADRFRARGLPNSFATLLASMDTAIANGIEDRMTGAVARLTEQAPITFEVFACQHARVWQRAA
jgi:uncharacterized protein YbjT (DUF2867 family)